ncbi:EsaB/YukD family protein [Actinoallomurus rhizosphaericola]|uniref:EsaB/YukD family protein n=1 Tax=Actinoallomurus rhizosphaericola TaxID=2952536 RepID=UPI0020933BFB|nr:EsaB/YukD family protein [Actinoallomurus rhizosphaericola]MCO6000302.1 EsaB/YukD family protein [Actinoallomurus rhizosphaericola]
MDEHCRITVVGERRQVDLAVPANAPITSYVNTLAELCAQPEADVMPAAWSLALPTGEPYAPERSLNQLGIVDGQVLYLRDVTAHEFEEPVVYDVAERVAEVSEGLLDHRWNAHARLVTATGIGLCWLVAVLVVLQARGRFGVGVLADLAATAGMMLPALAWVAGERRWQIPRRLREALALASVPLLALAARALAVSEWPPGSEGPGGSLTRGGFTLGALAVGALVGALLAYVAALGVLTCAVLAASAATAVVAGGLALLGANGTQTAAVAAVIAFVLLTFSAQTTSGLVAYAYRRTGERRLPGEGDRDEDWVAQAVSSATLLLVVWTCGLAAVLATSLVALAASGSSYGAWLDVCLGVALLLRIGEARLVAEAVPIAVACAAALCMLLVLGAGALGWSGWTAPACAGLVAVALLAYGLRNLVRHTEPPSRARPGWLTSTASVLGGAGIAFAVATFGAFDWFLTFGRGL